MATSGSTSVKVTDWDTLKFSWSTSSQHVADNRSIVTWTLQLVSGAYGKISSTASKDWSVTVNGSKSSGTNTVGIGNNATKTLASGQAAISHNADGTKTFSYSFSQEFGITFSGSSIGTKSGSGSGTLNTIPRATTPTLSASSANMGASITINTPRASSSFTHDLAYSFAGSGWVSIATGVATSKSWTVPDLATRIPNTTSGTMTIRCITKNGSTTIGTKTVLLTVKVPASVVPTISAVTLAEATAGLAEQFGAFIQGKTTIKGTVTAAGAKGSTIKSYRVTFYDGSYTSSTWTAGAVPYSGNITFPVTVTDSRGRTAEKSVTFNALAYTKPIIKAFKAYRCDASGAEDNAGEYVYIDYTHQFPALNGGNDVTTVFQRKLTASTTWETLTTSLTTERTKAQANIVEHGYGVVPGFSVDNQWDLRIQVVDWFDATSSYLTELPSGAVIFDVRADGLGFAFGKTSELEGVEFGWSPKGEVFGLGEAMEVIPEGSNLNNYTKLGIFACRSNTAVATLYNRPTDYAFTMRVYSALGNKDTEGAYWYLLQEVRPYQAAEPTYRRTLTRNSSGVWSYGGWMKDTVSAATTINAI